MSRPADSVLRLPYKGASGLELTIPSRFVEHPNFPFKAGDGIIIKIEGKRLVIEQANGDE